MKEKSKELELKKGIFQKRSEEPDLKEKQLEEKSKQLEKKARREKESESDPQNLNWRREVKVGPPPPWTVPPQRLRYNFIAIRILASSKRVTA